MLHQNLKSRLEQKGVSMKAYAEFLGISEKSVQNKIRGRTSFTYPEARRTKSILFPEYELEYLFADNHQDSA